ncbi:hypothetical protein AJ79_07986 [Helicocarpus griseus UAMH5409]|uniref:Alpha/beta hydrolase fold-3 domain-containing protein n=1 Tax=Helicocarpus griseus UAMH5409 TaxID=1447875 RepID=A0A2B7WWZ8_9EURO|nr:hypothetical protein AJ79_07986 [Helicocarpus griseus UAMH5409]
MAAQSALTVDSRLFKPSAAPEAANVSNKQISAMAVGRPNWWDIGAPKYREMAARGELILPAPALLPEATDFFIPSREAGRSIPCRVVRPAGATPPAGIFMHIHGGGWVMWTEKHQDPSLKSYADATNVVAISIGYRLAPEHPFPAAPHDCYDAAEWLIQNGVKEFGAPLKFVGGESAGGHLSMLTAQHLLTHPDAKFSQYQLRGLILHFGVFDLSWTPSVLNFNRDPPYVIGLADMVHYREAFLPDPTTNYKDPSISPLHFNFYALPEDTKLPAAYFTCGTEDLLLDDTMFMSTKWQMAGGEAIVRIVPGAPHGFIGTPEGMYPGTKETKEESYQFSRDRV